MQPENNHFYNSYGMKILRNLRRIMRAVDMHSKRLNSEYKVTAPQMICLVALRHNGLLTLSQLGEHVNLSPSTLTGILDRLEEKELVKRVRSDEDRRKILLHLTDKGLALTNDAPALLQDKLSVAISRLPELEQAAISLSIEKLVQIMNLDYLDASPNLLPGAEIAEQSNNQTNP